MKQKYEAVNTSGDLEELDATEPNSTHTTIHIKSDLCVVYLDESSTIVQFIFYFGPLRSAIIF